MIKERQVNVAISKAPPRKEKSAVSDRRPEMHAPVQYGRYAIGSINIICVSLQKGSLWAELYKRFLSNHEIQGLIFILLSSLLLCALSLLFSSFCHIPLGNCTSIDQSVHPLSAFAWLFLGNYKQPSAQNFLAVCTTLSIKYR